MSDTPPEVDELYRRLLLRRSPEDRLRMACRMFSTACALARAGMPAASGAQVRRQLFVRLYSEDLPDDRLREQAVRAVEEWRPR